jgi:hypothetical protein
MIDKATASSASKEAENDLFVFDFQFESVAQSPEQSIDNPRRAALLDKKVIFLFLIYFKAFL